MSIYLIFLATRIIDLHFTADSMDLSSLKFLCWAPWNYFISARVTFRPFKVIRGNLFWHQSKARMQLPISPSFVINPILYRSEAGFLLSWPHPYSILILGCSRCTRSPMLGYNISRCLKLSAMKLFSKYSNLCENHTWASRTDRQTDRQRQTTCCDIIAHCALCGIVR